MLAAWRAKINLSWELTLLQLWAWNWFKYLIWIWMFYLNIIIFVRVYPSVVIVLQSNIWLPMWWYQMKEQSWILKMVPKYQLSFWDFLRCLSIWWVPTICSQEWIDTGMLKIFQLYLMLNRDLILKTINFGQNKTKPYIELRLWSTQLC